MAPERHGLAFATAMTSGQSDRGNEWDAQNPRT
jgi:hypothetical protein